MIRGMKQFQRQTSDAQMGINALVSGIRGAQRVTEGLAASMERVAKAAAAAAASSQRIRGGGAVGMAGENTRNLRAPAARAPSTPLMLTYQPTPAVAASRWLALRAAPRRLFRPAR